jgi:hypothetical protein
LALECLEPRALPSFLPPVTYPVSAGRPEDMTVADLNGDGRADVVVGSFGSEANLFLGTGDGRLRGPVSLRAGIFPSGVRAADVNNDGKPDLVFARYSTSAGLSVLLGKGDGTFELRKNFTTGLYSSNRIAVGDLNGDGRLDVALTETGSSTANRVSVLMGNGDGTFLPPTLYEVGYWPESVQIGDVNQDGWPDLTVDNHDSFSISVLINHGDGTFGPQKEIALGDLPWGHALADVNQDGRPDLVVARGGDQISILVGNGDGSFQPPQSFPTGGLIPNFPVVSDFNHDGHADVAVVHSYDYDGKQPVSVLLGNGDGTLRPPLTYPSTTGYGIAAGDLNGDGYADLAATDFDYSRMDVLLNDGTWTAPLPPPGSGRSPEPAAAVPADASRSSIASPERVQVADDSAAVPGKLTPAVVVSLPRVMGAAPDTPRAFQVLPDPIA